MSAVTLSTWVGLQEVGRVLDDVDASLLINRFKEGEVAPSVQPDTRIPPQGISYGCLGSYPSV